MSANSNSWRASRLVAALAVATLTALLAPALASAHAILIRSSPPPGAELARSPAVISATFSEALNHALSSLVVTAHGGRRVAVTVRAGGAERIVLVPRRPLARGVYEVRWHSVSGEDGHELDGSYYFGVDALAPSASSSSLSDPLAGDGWLRILINAIEDGALLFFGAGPLCALLLARGRAPAAWALPDDAPAERAARVWARVLGAGGLALAAAVASTLLAAADAGQGLSGRALHDYLLTDAAGLARVVLLGTLALALFAAWRSAIVPAAALALAALAALAVAGHADSSSPRGVAIAADVIHLVGAAVWVGGLSQLAWALVPGLRAQDPAARRALAAHVVPRFGRIALPAFMVVLVAGVVNAAIELGSLPALWNSGYGRVLLVKGALVLAVALASYAHALRLRPRVAAGAGGALERRHWRILAGEPALGVAVVLVTALLVAYSPPNRPAAAAGHLALPTATAAPSAAVAPGQLAVAAQAGNAIVAAWVSHARGTLAARVRVLDVYEHPARFPLAVHDGRITARCGRGCYLVSLAAGASALEVSVREHGRAWRARLPARFVAGGDRLAARLAARVGAAQGALRSAVVRESLAGGATVPDLTVYRLRAPDRFAYQLRRGPRPIADTIIIGRREWNRAAGQGHWQESSYGPQPFSASSYLTWWGDYTDHARLLERGGGYAEIATLTEVPGLGPVWLRLRFDTVHGRLLDLRMITVAHFMHQSWTAFNRPVSIAPPAH